MSARLAALVFAALIALVAAFQLALALGAPWGAYAMGGAFPGVYPPAMRVAALVQIGVLALIAAVILARAGVALPRWRRAARPLAWGVVAFTALGVILNLITPSGGERLVWAPVAIVLFLASLRVALAR
ncbi:hypothetical protein [Phenylobacterium sp. J367]|uniref:hypothetical protein n=1 Tax=Phenylobacterium sp. J367 TaxID=2898435 RepID=UPI002150FD91|nr:hypothetical protein [Phenylobacterium sp. J367]MCR5877226.1 hypothetical protein [Phenylobacterium sp. J367]